MAKADTFRERFTLADTTKWYGYNANVTINGSRLSIVPTTSYPSLTSNTQVDLTDSYISVHLIQRPNVGNGTTMAAMSAQPSNGNYAQILVEGNNLVFREAISGAFTNVSIAFNATAHAWWRIREASNTIYWEYSADGLTWTTGRSKTKGFAPSLTATTIVLVAGYYGTEPSPGAAIFDDLNYVVLPTYLTGFSAGAESGIGGEEGPTIASRNYFKYAEWMWQPIPDSPALDPNSAAIVADLGSTAAGIHHGCALHDYATTIVPPSAITESTPRYTVHATMTGAWGPEPFDGYLIPIPAGTPIPPGTDGHIAIADPTTGMVFSLWQAVYTGGVWSCSWGAAVPYDGDGIEDFPHSSTATQLSRYGAVIRAAEVAAGQIPHALFFSSDMCDPNGYRYPAQKTDGDNAAGVAAPIVQGSRVQLDPSIDVAAIPGIGAGEVAVARALQIYGAYCGDRGGSRFGLIFEYQNDGNPGAVYTAAGFAWDYYDLTHIPWSSLRVLANWDGAAEAGPTWRLDADGAPYVSNGMTGEVTAPDGDGVFAATSGVADTDGVYLVTGV